MGVVKANPIESSDEIQDREIREQQHELEGDSWASKFRKSSQRSMEQSGKWNMAPWMSISQS